MFKTLFSISAIILSFVTLWAFRDKSRNKNKTSNDSKLFL